jgi:cobalt-zinc-cadmium efflux system outer membrane protein
MGSISTGQSTSTPLVAVLLVAAGVVGGGSGCASLPTTTDRAGVASAIGARTSSRVDSFRTTDEPAVPAGITLDDGLALDEAVAVALWNNPDFLADLTSLDIARADLVQAGLLKNPVLSLLFPLGPKQLESALNWSVDALWQRPRRVADARANAEAVAERLVAHGLHLVAEVKVAYFAALAAERAADLAATQAALAEQIATLTAGRARLGDVSDFDARLAQIDAAGAKAVQTSAQATRERMALDLRTLLGLPSGGPTLRLVAPAATVDACNRPLADLVTTAMAARPDVRAAELGVEAAGARAGLERAKILALTATIDMNGQGREGFEAGPGLAVELPVFSQNQGGRARAPAELTQATRRYQALQYSVAASIERARVNLLEARALDATLGATSVERERQQAERLYEAGEISLLSLLELRQRLGDVERSRLDVGLAVGRAQARLEEAVGRACEAK